jgi:hypothetical protein
MKQWEYKDVEVEVNNKNKTLNKLGQAGWEAYSQSDGHHIVGNYKVIVYLKREITQPPELITCAYDPDKTDTA